MAVIAHAKCAQNGGATTPPFDSTGANLIIVGCVIAFSGIFNVTDSEGNTYSAASGTADPGVVNKNGIFYCFNPITNPNHTVTIGGGSLNQSACVIAVDNGVSLLSGAGNSSTGSSTGSTTVQPGTVGPGASPALVVTFVSIRGDLGFETLSSVDSGFTISDTVAHGTNSAYGNGLAYLEQSVAANVNPTCTVSATPLDLAAVTNCFRLTAEYSLTADHGSFTLTGEAATAGRGFVGATGSYALTGLAANLNSTSPYAQADTGHYTLTGFPANFHTNQDYLLDAMPGQYVVTGNPAKFCKAKAWPKVDCTDSPWTTVRH